MIKWWWHLSRELKYDGMDGLRPKVQPGLATRWNNNRDNMPCLTAKEHKSETQKNICYVYTLYLDSRTFHKKTEFLTTHPQIHTLALPPKKKYTPEQLPTKKLTRW
jgi:hypothetical protein